MGAEIGADKDRITLRTYGRLSGADVVTAPYPGFPTDLQPLLTSLFCVCKGESTVRETVFERRFTTAEQLKQMGASIEVIGDTVRIRGAERLTGGKIEAADLRGGAGLVAAALAARGETVLTGVEHIDRGYENLCGKLQVLGANVLLTE
jgi:UDP-N-acetylglucosamine 1-carboxyvinyltransferase